MSTDSGPGNREIARRLFAAEFDDASLSYSESDEERAPNYVVTPTGARVNRLFAVGVLTEIEEVNEDSLRGRVVDPTGAFVTYAGQYQPDEHAFLSRAEPPTFVALSGKARTFEPEDSDRVFTSVRPESINEVDADTRDRWVVSAAERTLHRIAVFAEALDSELRGDRLHEALAAAGVDASLAAGIPKAIEHYDTGTAYLEAVRTLAVEAVEQVAGERDAVGSLETAPDEESPTELGALPAVEIDLDDAAVEEAAEGSTEEEASEEEEPTEKPDAEPEPTAEESDEADEPSTPEESEAEGSESESEASEPEESETAETEESEAPEPETTGAEPATESTTDAKPDAEEEPEGAPEPEPEETDSEGSDSDESGDELGDFDADESVQETVAEEAEELEDFDPEETVPEDDDALTEDERREVEEEFGAEFSTGSEVGEPGEAGIDVPTSEEELEEIEAEVTGEEPDEPEPEEPAVDADVDLESAVVDAMAELDDGDGADHDAVVEHVVDEHGVDADAVEAAIQDAMMSGKCYEPGDGTLKAI